MYAKEAMVKARVVGETSTYVIGYYFESNGKPMVLAPSGKGFSVMSDFINRHSGMFINGKLPIFENDTVLVMKDDIKDIMAKVDAEDELTLGYDYDSLMILVHYNRQHRRFEGMINCILNNKPVLDDVNQPVCFSAKGLLLNHLITRPNCQIVKAGTIVE